MTSRLKRKTRDRKRSERTGKPRAPYQRPRPVWVITLRHESGESARIEVKRDLWGKLAPSPTAVANKIRTALINFDG